MEIKLGKDKTVYLFHRVSGVDLALSIRHMAVMLESGLALEDSLEVIAKQSPDPKLREAYLDILQSVRSGKVMSSAMRKYPKIFSDVIISIVEVGEQGGTLEKNLNFLAVFLKKNYELLRKVKGAMLYPAIILILTAGEMLGVIYFILPKMESLFNAFDDPPALTMFILNFSKFTRENIVLIAIGLVILGVAVFKFFQTPRGLDFKDKLALRVPIVRDLIQKNILASFSRTLGILLESGIPLADALKITAATSSNRVYVKIFDQLQKEVQKGNNIADFLEKYPKHFPPLYVKMISIGEKTATLEDNLLYLYDYYAEEVEEMTSNMSTIIEPLLLIFIGVMVAILAISIVGPIYQMTGNINQL